MVIDAKRGELYMKNNLSEIIVYRKLQEFIIKYFCN